jgi:hypothetical protein
MTTLLYGGDSLLINGGRYCVAYRYSTVRAAYIQPVVR